MIDKKQIESIRINDGKCPHPSELETNVSWGSDKGDVKKATKKLYEEVLALQEKLYAEKKESLLVVFQAMDAAGKDSTIRKLTTNLNVQGARVQSFGKPSKKEMSHDFLWRVHQVAPANGEIVFFNRSHYEDVLVVKVHGWVSDDVLERRYEQINNFESLLADNGTKIVKFMLNISPEYQLSRFKNRLDVPGKNWKFNPGDLDERKLWTSYMSVFQEAIQRCSSEAAPWYIVPSEQRWLRDYIVAKVMRDTLLEMNPQYPEPDYEVSEFSSETIS